MVAVGWAAEVVEAEEEVEAEGARRLPPAAERGVPPAVCAGRLPWPGRLHNPNPIRPTHAGWLAGASVRADISTRAAARRRGRLCTAPVSRVSVPGAARAIECSQHTPPLHRAAPRPAHAEHRACLCPASRPCRRQHPPSPSAHIIKLPSPTAPSI